MAPWHEATSARQRAQRRPLADAAVDLGLASIVWPNFNWVRLNRRKTNRGGDRSRAIVWSHLGRTYGIGASTTRGPACHVRVAPREPEQMVHDSSRVRRVPLQGGRRVARIIAVMTDADAEKDSSAASGGEEFPSFSVLLKQFSQL